MADIVLECVENWINQHERIQWAPPVNRGWERWAQLDFYLHLRNVGIVASVEDQCYASGKFCDISTSPIAHPSGATIPGAVFELKVLNRTESASAYAAKLKADFLKLGEALQYPFLEHQKCSYGIAPRARLEEVLKEKFQHHGPVTNQDFSWWMKVMFPDYHYETTKSKLGEDYVISFARPA